MSATEGDNKKPKVKVIKKPIQVQVQVKDKKDKKDKKDVKIKIKNPVKESKFKIKLPIEPEIKICKSRTGQLPSMPSNRIFSVSRPGPSSIGGTFRRNIVTITLDRNDVNVLEEEFNKSNNVLLNDINDPMDPRSWDPSKNIQAELSTKPSNSKSTISNPNPGLGSLGCLARTIKQTKPKTKTKTKAASEDRKNLIINSGIKRTVSHAVHVTGDRWPSNTCNACLYCCHTFETTPVGIPYGIINDTFMCYGNFCSYNCAKRYLCPNHDDEDDMATIQTYNDLYVGDEHGEKLQLLELLYHIETDAPIIECIKPSPKRLTLKFFGGNKTIGEYRETFDTNTTFHIFKTPIASMGYQIEECADTRMDSQRTLRNLSLDVDKLEKARHELLKVKHSLRKELKHA